MRKFIMLGFVIWIVIFSGCNSAETTPTAAIVEDYVPVISVTGKVLPARRTTVSAQASGTVLEIFVAQGDEVKAGDLLLQLDPTDAQLAVRQAEAALEAARAELALLQAQPRPEAVAVLQAQAVAAQATITQAIAHRDRVAFSGVQADIVAAEASIIAAQADRLAAYETHEQTMTCHEFNLNGEKKTVCPLLGAPEEQARYQLQVADERLNLAQTQLDALLTGASDRTPAADAAVQAAREQRDVVLAELSLLQAGPSAGELAAVEAAVQKAEAALAEAQVMLARTEARAPFAGIVGDVHVREGEFLLAGSHIVTLGDLDTLRVETSDLDEISVGQVAVGQKVEIAFEGLPEQTFTGRVVGISPMSDSKAGGVNYTAIVEVDRIAPDVRWGMTAFVDIESE